jgi:hypothetical protein
MPGESDGAGPEARNRQAPSRDTQRTSESIAAKHLDVVLGRTLRRDVEADDVLTWEMV